MMKSCSTFKHIVGALKSIHAIPYFQSGQEIQKIQSEVNGKGFYIQQIYTECLSEYAYYIESKGEAILIDPLRDIDTYLKLLEERKTKLKYVLLTHFHADFVAGHHNLKRETNAQIIMGPSAEGKFIDKKIKDSEELTLGDIKIRALHTPGHTLESTCYLLLDKDSKPISLFTGDTLFLGEVGRPDLAAKSELTTSDLAGILYRSLREKIMTLPPDVNIYPAHGAGSSCGKNIQSGFTCTVGKQSQSNYALQPMSQQQFIDIVTTDIKAPPFYFFHDVAMNKADDIQDLSKALLTLKQPIKAVDVKNHLEKGVQILDSRASIINGFIEGSINVPLFTGFANWVGQLIPPHQKLIIVADPGMEEQTMMRLLRIGYDNILGYLDGGIESWKYEIAKSGEYSPKEFMEIQMQDQSQILLDVRNHEECKKGILNGATMIPLVKLEQSLSQLDKNKNINVYCGSGVRAKIAVTILKKNGFNKFNICQKGFQDIVSETHADHHEL